MRFLRRSPFSRAASVPALFCTIVLAACAAPAAQSESSATATGVPTANPSTTAFVVPPRPTEFPPEGNCEEERRCFGVLEVGGFQTEFLDPNFTFEIPDAGWVNYRSSGGQLDLHPVDAPGDELIFLQRVSAREADGGRAAGVGATAAELGEWLGERSDLVVEPMGAVSVGGLEGLAFDIAVSDETPSVLDDCPTQPCVMLVGGTDPAEMPSWVWDVALWRGAAMRIWLLDAPDQVVAFEATAWDGTQLEDFLARAQPIVDSIRFER